MWKMALMVSVGVGLLGANVFIHNNLRHYRGHKNRNKRTKAVIFGTKSMKITYIVFAYVGLALIWFGMKDALNDWGWAGYVAVGIWFMPVIAALFKFTDHRLNKVLRYTAILLLATIIWTLIDVIMNFDSIHTALAQIASLPISILPTKNPASALLASHSSSI